MSRGAARPHPADVLPALIITAGVALALVPFVVDLPLPGLVAIAIVSIVARSLAPVHQHCHAHRAVFGHRGLDRAYDLVLALAAGNVTTVWQLQHVQGHHRHYLEGARDPACNTRFGGGRLRFTILGDAMSFVDALRLARGRIRARLWRQQLGLIAILIGLVVADRALALVLFVAPWLLLRWAVFWFSYAQHDDVPRIDVYSGSVTHFGWTNRLYLNVGHHTAHHDRPTLHWTELPAHTERLRDKIPAACLR